MSYCIIKNNEIVAGPIERPSNWDGINNFNQLDNITLKDHGWYPVILINSHYNPYYQERSEPLFSFDDSVVTITYIITNILTIDDIKKKKIKEVATQRYLIETSGIMIDGLMIRTDRESQSQISSAYNASINGVFGTLNFKAVNKWVTLTAAQMINIGETVYNHIQFCFNKEKEHFDNLNNMNTIEDILNYDIYTGWDNDI